MARRVVATPAQVGQATRKRKKFETANPERMAAISDQQFGDPKTGTGRTARQVGLSPATLYRAHGIEETTSLHSAGQQELPGMASVKAARETGLLGGENSPQHQSRTLPDLAPAPPRWEDMGPKQQGNTLKRAREFGVTPQSMHASLGAQVDQAHLRAQGQGATPYAAHFYAGGDPSRPSTPDAMQPRDVLLQSAKTNNVDFSTQAVTNGITSPKSKFSMRSSKTGRTVYPNDQAASFAIHAVQQGVPPAQVDPSGHGIIALHSNVKRAAGAVMQRLQGRSMEDLRNPGGSSPFGPKTGPYTNSWTDPHGSSQFFVSDVHSGGGGMAPHLSHESPYMRDESGGFKLSAKGKMKRAPSEREKYLDIPGIHALHDHVARSVMHERGLQSLSGMQATQWGEEQAGRGTGTTTSARKQTLVEQPYPERRPAPQLHGQMDIFGGESRSTDVAAHTQPLNVTQFSSHNEEPVGRDRDKAERAIAARSSNTIKKRGLPKFVGSDDDPWSPAAQAR